MNIKVTPATMTERAFKKQVEDTFFCPTVTKNTGVVIQKKISF
jgi:hypothetical protein